MCIVNRSSTTDRAFEKTVIYKRRSRNHLLDQVESFRVGDRGSDREDDLLDTFCYGIALALGNNEGFLIQPSSRMTGARAAVIRGIDESFAVRIPSAPPGSRRPEMISYATEWQDVSAACDEVFVKINGKLRYRSRRSGGSGTGASQSQDTPVKAGRRVATGALVARRDEPSAARLASTAPPVGGRCAMRTRVLICCPSHRLQRKRRPACGTDPGLPLLTQRGARYM